MTAALRDAVRAAKLCGFKVCVFPECIQRSIGCQNAATKVLEIMDALEPHVAAREAAAVASAVLAERKACEAVLQDWIKQFGGEEPKHLTARLWAMGAILDCIDNIRARSTQESGR